MATKKESLDKFYGINLALVLFEKRFDDIERVFVRKGEEGRFGKFLSQLSKARKVYRLVPNDELNTIADTEHHEGICIFAKPKTVKGFQATIKQYVDSFHGNPLIILDHVQNPHNIGSVYRSAAYFGFYDLIQISKSRISVSGSLARISEGGTEIVSTSFVRDSLDLLACLKEHNVALVSTDLNTTNSEIPYEYLTKPYALVLGAEQLGVSKEILSASDLTFRIDGVGKVQSLNVGVSSGIVFNTLYSALKS